jgi:hypothetical protein
MSRNFCKGRANTQEPASVDAYSLVCHLIRMRRRIMNTEMYGMPNNIDVQYNLINPADERIHGGFGHGGFGHGGFGHGGFGFGRRPFGFGFGFGLPFLGGLAAGALLSRPPYPYPYPYYPYPPYPYYPWY